MENMLMMYGGGAVPAWALSALPLLMLWSIFWKGLALWHAAQRGKHWWFVAFLLVSTLGVLEIVYLFGFAKLQASELFTSRPGHAGHES
jgi:hypothetical protein